MHPAYRGLVDYDALKARSNNHYDQVDQNLRADDGYGGYNNTMNLMSNQANKISPWAPYFQSLQENGVNKVGMDTGRPHGIADAPTWHQQGDVGNLSGTGYQIPHQPLMDSTNLAGAQAPTQRTLALEGLSKAGPQAQIYDPNDLASVLAQFQPKPAGK